MSARQLRKPHKTRALTHTRLHHFDFFYLFIYFCRVRKQKLPLSLCSVQLAMPSVCCGLSETLKWGQHRRSTAVHPHLHSNHYFGLFIAFIHYSSALFPGKCSPRLSHQCQTCLFTSWCHATFLSSLYGIRPLKCQSPPCPGPIEHPSICWFRVFLCLCPVVCRCVCLLALYLSLCVFYSLIYALSSLPLFLWAPGRSVGTLRGEVQV